MPRSLKNISPGFTLQYRQSSRQPDKCIINLDYADDIAGMDDTVEGLQETTDNIAKYCGLGGLKMNAKKSEIMVDGNWERYVAAPTPREL